MRHIFIAVAASVAIGFTAAGQQATPIPDGTRVKVKLLQFISSETSQPGEAVKFEVAEDVAIRGFVVIARGTPAMGSVGWAKAYRNSPSVWTWWSRTARGQLAFRISETTSVNGEGRTARWSDRQVRISRPAVYWCAGTIPEKCLTRSCWRRRGVRPELHTDRNAVSKLSPTIRAPGVASPHIDWPVSIRADRPTPITMKGCPTRVRAGHPLTIE